MLLIFWCTWQPCSHLALAGPQIKPHRQSHKLRSLRCSTSKLERFELSRIKIMCQKCVTYQTCIVLNVYFENWLEKVSSCLVCVCVWGRGSYVPSLYNYKLSSRRVIQSFWTIYDLKPCLESTSIILITLHSKLA